MSLIGTLWPAWTNFRRAPKAATEKMDLPYAGPSSSAKQKLDLFVPSQPVGAPIALFVHGGAWRTQDRRFMRGWLGLYSNVGRALAGHGFVTGIAGYRQNDATTAVADLRLATETLAAHATASGADRRRLLLIGHSAGAHLVAWLSLDPTMQVAGNVCIGGYADPNSFAETIGRDGPRLRHVYRSAAARSWDVGTQLNEHSPPTLCIAGTREPPQILAAIDAWAVLGQQRGAVVRTETAPGLGHMATVLGCGRVDDPVSAAIVAFEHDCTRGAADRRRR